MTVSKRTRSTAFPIRLGRNGEAADAIRLIQMMNTFQEKDPNSFETASINVDLRRKSISGEGVKEGTVSPRSSWGLFDTGYLRCFF